MHMWNCFFGLLSAVHKPQPFCGATGQHAFHFVKRDLGSNPNGKYRMYRSQAETMISQLNYQDVKLYWKNECINE